jgi:arylsulfatase
LYELTAAIYRAAGRLGTSCNADDRFTHLTGLRYAKWKAVFMEQREHGLDVWREPLTPLRVPKIFDLNADPFERADIESGDYERWFIDRAFLLVPAQAVVVQFLASFQEFPPRQ